MDLQQLLDRAWNLKKEGELPEALKLYSQALDILVGEASQYAHASGDTVVDEGKSRKILPSHFEKCKEYFKRDKVAAMIYNNMGTIWAELSDFNAAKKFFLQAIDLTPDDEKYEDPHIALKELES